MKLKSILCTVFLVLTSTLIQSQNALADSLIELEKNPAIHDTLRIKLCGDISWELLGSDINSSLKFAMKELSLSEKLNRKSDIAQAKSDIGSIYNRKSIYDTALIYYFEALALRQSLKHQVKIAGILTNIATVYMRQNKFNEALDINFKTLNIFEEIKDDTKQAIVLGNIANLYYELEQNKPALEFLKKALTKARNSGHRITEANVLVNIGGIFYEEGTVQDTLTNKTKVDSAIVNFKQAEKIFIDLKSNYNLGVVYNNIGRAYLAQKIYKEALSNYQKGLRIRIELEDKFGIALSYLNIGGIEFILNQNKNALAHLDTAAIIFKSLKNYVNLKQAYLKIAEIYEKLGDYPKSLIHFQLFSTYKDSVYTAENAEKMSEMNIKYQTEKKDLELSKNKAELQLREEEAKQKNIMLVSILSLAILLSTAIFLFYRKKQIQQKAELDAELATQKELRAKSIIEAEEKERIRIATDLHDGVGQLLSAAKLNLSSLENKINLNDASQQTAFQNAISLVDDSVKEVRSVSHNMMPNTLLKLGLASAVKEFVTKIQGTPNLKVNLEIVGLNNRLEQDKETVIYRVIQEVVSNIIKHAKATELTLQIIKHDNELSILIEDNGIGFDTSKINSFEGIGLKNILSRIEFINGTVHFDSVLGRGTTVIIELKTA